MAQLVDLVNRGLSRLGAETITTLLPEDSPQAAIAFQLAQPRIDALLASWPWRFATQNRQLTRIDETLPDGVAWTYQFAVPNDCVRFLRSSNLPPVSYEIYAAPTSQERRLYADEDEVWADMVMRIETALFPPHVEQAATAAMAAELAMPMTANPQIARLWEAEYERQLAKAQTQDANEQPMLLIDDGYWLVNARYG